MNPSVTFSKFSLRMGILSARSRWGFGTIGRTVAVICPGRYWASGKREKLSAAGLKKLTDSDIVA
jgi:hypothetical protein